MSDEYTKQFKRLTKPLLELINEQGFGGGGGSGYMGGQADLTPLKNKAREAMEALNDAQKAADSGRLADATEALRRARASIDAALGGHMAPYGAMAPPQGSASGGSGGGGGGSGGIGR